MEFLWIEKWKYPSPCIRKEYYIVNTFSLEYFHEFSEIISSVFPTEKYGIYLTAEC